MRRIATKLSLLAVLGGIYFAGLHAASGSAEPQVMKICCQAGNAVCCGTHCFADKDACWAK